VQVANEWGPFAAKAHAVTLHIGTNDILQGNFSDGAAALADMGPKLEGLLMQIQALAPAAHVYVASIIHFSNATGLAALNEQVAAYNAAIPGIVQKFKSASFVNMAGDSDLCEAHGGCCPGGVHPTVVGYDRMAKVWHRAVLSTIAHDERGNVLPEE
jgi:lysophospholipase L1-like esterase